jgi:hypothetical protein
MDLKNLKTQLGERGGKRPSHPNIIGLVDVDSDPQYNVIRVPKAITEEYIYESGTKDKDGDPKRTPMAYVLCANQDPAHKTVILPFRCPDGTEVKMRLGGFSIFVQSVE